MNVRPLVGTELDALLSLYAHLHEHDLPLPQRSGVEASGCHKVMLLTGRNDEGTLRFYEDAGFIRDGKTGFVARQA